MSLLAPIMDLAQSEDGEKLFAAARQFFGNSNITVNLLPALLLGQADRRPCDASGSNAWRGRRQDG